MPTPTTGRYKTRAELESAVRDFYAMRGTTLSQVARLCGITYGTAASIISPPPPKPPKKRGRKPTTGHYATRAALESAVRDYSADGLSLPQVARLCGISHATAAKILNQPTNPKGAHTP
jgi:AcrR family transcriptional regulator